MTPGGMTPGGMTPTMATPGGTTPGGGSTPGGGFTPGGLTPSGMTPSGMTPSGVTPTGAKAMAMATPTPGHLMSMTPEQLQAYTWQREIDERNRPLSDDELDTLFPPGYKVKRLNMKDTNLFKNDPFIHVHILLKSVIIIDATHFILFLRVLLSYCKYITQVFHSLVFTIQTLKKYCAYVSFVYHM